MSHLPKSELVGTLQPYSINPRDVGKNWFNIGAIVTARFIIYLGNGIAIAGDGVGHIFRSTDYGSLWSDTGAISGGTLFSGVYLGNGITLIGDNAGHVFRNTNFGDNGTSGSPTGEWVDQGAITAAGADVNTFSYLGDGIVIFGASDGHIFRHVNYGDTNISAWVDLGNVTGANNVTSLYLENGIVIVGTDTGHIWRSTTFGSGGSWTDLGAVIPSGIVSRFLYPSYLGNGIVVIGDNNGHIFRSNDFGATWTDLGLIGTAAVPFITSIYLGDGVVTIGDGNGHIFRSSDFGLAWTDLGAIGALFNCSAYLDNGVGIFGDFSTGNFYRSEVSYKTNESQVNYTRVPVDITASRALNSTFTNIDKTRSLMVMVTTINQSGAGPSVAITRALSDAASPPVTVLFDVGLSAGLTNETNEFQVVFIVKPGLNYRVNSVTTNLGIVSLNKWFEMYI